MAFWLVDYWDLTIILEYGNYIIAGKDGLDGRPERMIGLLDRPVIGARREDKKGMILQRFLGSWTHHFGQSVRV